MVFYSTTFSSLKTLANSNFSCTGLGHLESDTTNEIHPIVFATLPKEQRQVMQLLLSQCTCLGSLGIAATINIHPICCTLPKEPRQVML